MREKEKFSYIQFFGKSDILEVNNAARMAVSGKTPPIHIASILS